DMDARLPTVEVVACAVPLSGVETDMVRVVVTADRERESVDRDPIELARVAVRLLDLADQGAVHRRIPPQPRWGRIHEAAVSGRAPDRCGGRGATIHLVGPRGHPPKRRPDQGPSGHALPQLPPSQAFRRAAVRSPESPSNADVQTPAPSNP